MAETVRLCSAGELEPGAARRFEVGAHRIALVRVGDDFYAIGDRCSHEESSLSEGEVYEQDCEIECPKHGSLFSLSTGEPVSLPATKPVPVYQVVRAGEDVEVVLP